MSYQELTEALSRAGAQPEVSELHGSLCARLCLRGEHALAGWLDEGLAGSDPANAARSDAARQLAGVHEQTWATLAGGEMGLVLLLPDDAASLAVRARALGLWCQGFLHGLACSGIPELQRLRDEHAAEHVAEFIEDLAEISRVGFDAEDDEATEQAEGAYVELVEFLRAGVLISFEELSGLRAAVAPEHRTPPS